MRLHRFQASVIAFVKQPEIHTGGAYYGISLWMTQHNFQNQFLKHQSQYDNTFKLHWQCHCWLYTAQSSAHRLPCWIDFEKQPELHKRQCLLWDIRGCIGWLNTSESQYDNTFQAALLIICCSKQSTHIDCNGGQKQRELHTGSAYYGISQGMHWMTQNKWAMQSEISRISLIQISDGRFEINAALILPGIAGCIEWLIANELWLAVCNLQNFLWYSNLTDGNGKLWEIALHCWLYQKNKRFKIYFASTNLVGIEWHGVGIEHREGS